MRSARWVRRAAEDWRWIAACAALAFGLSLLILAMATFGGLRNNIRHVDCLVRLEVEHDNAFDQFVSAIVVEDRADATRQARQAAADLEKVRAKRADLDQWCPA